ncbi:hypothetical protein LSUB1_G005680, partial [Lachnellula subtilissima]
LNSITETGISGWTPSPNVRGTADIVFLCLLTIGFCCWTAVCPNVPALSDSPWLKFRDKFDLACIGLLGPEFLLGIAQFKNAKFLGWSLTHAFFADMGGFILQTLDLPLPIPLDAKELFYLVENNHVDYPNLSKEEINDKNKADEVAR